MSSTRLRNLPGEYKLSKLQNTHICSNRLSPFRTVANDTVLPELGFNASYLPNHVLSSNAIDIESDLFGVGSSNLEIKKTPVVPKTHRLPIQSFFERPDIIIPNEFVLEQNQRPIIP